MDKKLAGMIGKTKWNTLEVKEGRGAVILTGNTSNLEGMASFSCPWEDRFYNLKAASKGIQLTEEKGEVPDLSPIGECVASINDPIILAEFAQYLPTIGKYVSDDSTRYYMNGISIERENVVATDGRCLAFYKLASPLWEGDEFKNIIMYCPPMLFDAIKKFTLAGIEIFGDKARSNFQVKFDFIEYGISFLINCIQGQFPMWTRVVPEYRADEKIGLTIPSKETLKEMETIARIKKDKTHRQEFKDATGRSVFFNFTFLQKIQESGIRELSGVETERAWIGTAGKLTAVVMPMQALH